MIFVSSIISAQKINATFSSAAFYIPESKSYLETYLSINSSTVSWENIKSNDFQASVEITYIFRQNDNIIQFSKEISKSPVILSTELPDAYFLNVQRITLANGDYDLEIKIRDLKDDKKSITTNTKVSVDIHPTEISLSDIQCLDRYEKSTDKSITSKSGYDLIPYTFNFYPNDKEEFKFYVEVYNTDKVFGKNEPYLVSYYLKNYESNQLLDHFKRYSRRTSKTIDPILASLNIAKLPTGNFEFVIEIRSKTNEIMTLKSFLFQNENTKSLSDLGIVEAVEITNTFAEKITEFDSLAFCVQSLSPIIDQREIEFGRKLIEEKNTPSLQRFLYFIWSNKNKTEPELAFIKYMRRVHAAQETFGTSIRQGFNTDRGRVFLKYGAANSRAKEYNDPGWLPYEIWHYYSTGDQRNVKFVFYADDRSVGDFHLLHSTARGEVNNYRWRIQLMDSPTGGTSIDDTGEDEKNWGSKVNDLWNNPR